MTEEFWLVCGTRRKGYEEIVFRELDRIYWNRKGASPKGSNYSPIIVEGCCPDSADAYTEEWAKNMKLENLHYPSKSGEYLQRNIEMVKKATFVIAFWDGYSYGTAQAIAQATMRDIPTKVIYLKKQGVENK